MAQNKRKIKRMGLDVEKTYYPIRLNKRIYYMTQTELMHDVIFQRSYLMSRPYLLLKRQSYISGG